MKVYALALAVSLAVLFTAGEGLARPGQELNKVCLAGEGEGVDALTSFGICLGYIEGVYDDGEYLD